MFKCKHAVGLPDGVCYWDTQSLATVKGLCQKCNCFVQIVDSVNDREIDYIRKLENKIEELTKKSK